MGRQHRAGLQHAPSSFESQQSAGMSEHGHLQQCVPCDHVQGFWFQENKLNNKGT